MKISFLILFALSGIVSRSISQTLSLIPDGVFAECPGKWITFSVTNTSSASCSYDWTVTNGEIQGGFLNGNISTFSGGNIVQIKWFDTTSGGSVKAQSNCNPSSGNGIRTWSIPILSVNGVNPGAIDGNDQVEVNVTGNQIYSISQINYPNVGSGDPNPYQVNGYEWEIPAGWTVISGGNTKTITVKPDNCSGGNLRVRGKNTQCFPLTFYSNWSTVKTITRTLSTPGPIAGPASVDCSDITTITYQISPVSGATSYTWTIPHGWSGSSTTNTIAVTPNGLNAGNISVVANGCGITSAPSTLSIPINLFNPSTPPTIIDSSPVCYSGNTFTLNNLPPNSTVTWSHSSYLTDVSGQGTTTYTVRANSITSRASGWIEANIMTPCGPVPPIRKSVWIGKPLLAATYSNDALVRFTNPGDPIYYNSVPNLIEKTVDMVSSGAQGVWIRVNANPTNAFWSGSYNSLRFYFYQVGQTATFRYSATNSCGTTAQDYSFKSIISGGGGCDQYSVSPNPSNNVISITAPAPNIPSPCGLTSLSVTGQVEQTDSNVSIQFIGLYDTEGQLRRSKKYPTDTKTAELDISDLRKGVYILKISDGFYIETHRIIKE